VATKQTATVTLSSIQRREIALSALVDERTLNRALAGKRVRDLTRERIRRVLADRGMLSILSSQGR